MSHAVRKKRSFCMRDMLCFRFSVASAGGASCGFADIRETFTPSREARSEYYANPQLRHLLYDVGVKHTLLLEIMRNCILC